MDAGESRESKPRVLLLSVVGILLVVGIYALQAVVAYACYGQGVQFRPRLPALKFFGTVSYWTVKIPILHVLWLGLWLWMWESGGMKRALPWGSLALALVIGMLTVAAGLTAVHP